MTKTEMLITFPENPLHHFISTEYCHSQTVPVFLFFCILANYFPLFFLRKLSQTTYSSTSACLTISDILYP